MYFDSTPGREEFSAGGYFHLDLLTLRAAMRRAQTLTARKDVPGAETKVIDYRLGPYVPRVLA